MTSGISSIVTFLPLVTLFGGGCLVVRNHADSVDSIISIHEQSEQMARLV